MLLTLGAGTAWGETGSATITFSEQGLTNAQNVHNKSFALGDYFTVTYTKNFAATNPTYYNSGFAIRCYATKNTTNGNIITIAQTTEGAEVNAYITKVTYSGTHNKKGKTAFTYSGSPTSSDANNAIYAASSKVTTATATLKETAGGDNGQFYSTGITIEYTYETSAPPATPYTVNFYKTSTTFDEVPETEAGSGVTPPTMEAECGEWSFQGWSESFSNSETSTTVLSTITLENGKYYPTADVNLYPVYTKTSTGGGTEYVLSDIGAISSGDIFVFADESNYALTNNNGTASAVGVKSITVTNDKITSTVDATIEWQLTGNNTSGYTFYPGTGTTSWLYCKTTANSSDNNNMRVGTGNRKLFIVNDDGYLVTNDTYIDRYLSRYNTQDFRGYTSTSTNPVKPKLYKKTTGSTTYYYSYPECSDDPEPVIVKTLKSIAVSGMTTEYVEGAEFTFDGTCTATYSVTKNDVAQDDETKTVTPTVSAPNMTQIGEQTVSVSYKEGEVTAETSYTINITEKPKYTITWNNAGTTNTTEVVQGEAFGTLPEPADCDNGKKFMGWTAVTSVNNDGSGITYIKPTDKPTANTTYYAVFAVVEGGDATPTTATVTVANYATANSWATGTKYTTMNIDANITATANGGGNTGKYYSSGNGTWRFYQNETPSLTIAAAEGYEIQTVKVTYTEDKTGVLTLEGSNVSSGTVCEINAVSVTFSVGNTTSATNGNVQVSAIEVVYAPAAKKTDYSLNCDIHQDPYLTLLETAINFGTVAQNETVTETLSVSGGYLAEDVTLTISGTNASFFSVSPATIAKADDVEETVTVTYTPTATGDHTATLTIKTGDITKEIALSGKVLAPGKWVLVKDIATLSAGDEIIIAASGYDYAIGALADNGNNFKGAAITKVGETANADAGVTVLKVEATGDAEVPYAFKAGSNYLYAASSSANQLKGKTTLDVNGQWAVTITEGVASIVAAKSSNRNVMQYNPNNGTPIFACYAPDKLQQPLAIYRNSENVVKPVISGDADFTGSTQVTITAQSGLTVYYTTDGADPDNTSTQYTAPFTINATTTVKAIAYDASSNASGVAEMTFTKHELVNVATAMALAKDEVAYFAEFEVVKVVTGKGNIYIKDASGHGLIYDNTLAGELKDGDRVQGFVGISSPYNGLPEAKPVDGLKVTDLTITSGIAAEPYDFTSTVIAATDINKYVVFNDVEIATAVSMSKSNKEFSLDINGNNVAFYNQFEIEKTLEADKIYDIYGFVAIYNGNLQVYFYQALEEGEVVTKYTVTYNAGGATGEVPVDDNEYTEGSQVTLKSATGLTKEGYDYKGWKVTDEGGNEIAVSSNKFNMPASNVTVTAQWEEIVVTPREDFSAGLWVIVTDASELAANDYIIVAAKDYNVAMVSYDYDVRKNNCGQTDITKFGNNNCFLTWKEEIGVFQLANSGSNYTIQDVNTEEYLYAAGGESSNYLKAADEIPADAEAAKPYIWSITIADGVTTVQATSNGRNLLKYNATNNSGQLFSCYASGQKDIALYKYVSTLPTYTVSATANPAEGGNITGAATYELGATVTLTATANEGYVFVNWKKGEETVSSDAVYTFTATEDITLVANFEQTESTIPTITLTTGDNSAVIAANIGKTVNVKIERSFTANDGYYTLCVPFNMPAEVIGKAYSLGTITEHVSGQGININLKEKNELSAGMPYLVLPKANMSELVVENVTIAEDDIAGQGVSNEERTVNIFFQGYYSAPGVKTNGTTEYYVGNDGYLYNGEVDILGLCGLFTITDKNGDPLKVRARVVAGENGVTGVEDIITNDAPLKVIENGQLIIIRDGVKYNVQGQVIK